MRHFRSLIIGLGRSRSLLLVAGMIAGFAAQAWPQATSSISGIVSDSSGAAVPRAALTVKNTETAMSRTVDTNDAGLYRVLSLPVGHYEVKAEREGFKTGVRSGISLVVGQEAVVNFSLEVGELMQQVTVTGEAPLVNTTTAETAGLVGERAVKDLPLNGRSFDNLITLNAGTINFSPMHTPGSNYTGGLGNRFSISGRRPDANLFLLNGVEYGGNGSIATSPGSVSRQLLGIDAVREFNVLKDNYSAEYGKRSGGQINIVTMSGTNQLHGSVFEFMRNSALDARNFFDQKGIPPFQRNNFGASVGGPIVKDQTFLFGNYEGFRQRLGLSHVAFVPDDNARRGLLPDPSRPGQLIDVPLAPGVAPYLNLWPVANGPSAGGGAALFFSNPKQRIREEFGTVRFDHTLFGKDSLYGVYTIDDGESLTPGPDSVFETSLIVRSQVLSLTAGHVFSPSLINTFSFGFSRALFSSSDIAVIDIPPSLAYLQGQQVGRLSIGTIGGSGGGGLTLAGANAPIGSVRNFFTYTDGLQITKGSHLIAAGVWFGRLQENSEKNLNIGRVTFATLTDLLQGRAQVFAASPLANPIGLRSLQGAWYIQDTIKARPNLTINAGLRHEFTNGWNEVAGRFGNYDNGPDGVILSQPYVGSQMFTKNNAKRLFGPRVGLAWDPFSDGKMAIRAGFGMYYSLIDDLAFWSGKNPPFNFQVQLQNTTFPIPQITPATALSLPGALVSPLGVQPDIDTPVLISYNLRMEREITPNLAVSASYVGFHGYNDLVLNDFNTTFPTICSAPQNNCPAGLADGTKYFPATRRRNPTIGSAKNTASLGSTYYNGLQMEVTRRLSQGITFRANYTWSKSMDVGSSLAALANNATTILDPENLLLDRGLSGFDIRNRFSLSGSYELPFGQGKPLLGGIRPAFETLAGGWQLNFILGLQGGLPFSPQLGFNHSRNGNTSQPDRPSLNPSFSGARIPGRVEQWYDPAAFALPVPGTYGNAARDSIIGPGLATIDLSFLKTTRVSERMSLQFRAEAFNLANRANFGVPSFLVLNPNGSVRTTAGRITGTATTSRQIQFGLKLSW